jgi:hypothetical protein
VLIVDETGFIKIGTRSVGCSGSTPVCGPMKNCQIRMFLAHASRTGRADRA